MLDKGGTITGMVVDSTGKPMAGLRVGACDPQDPLTEFQPRRHAETDARGHFELLNIEWSRSTVTVGRDQLTILLVRHDVEVGTDMVLQLTEDDLPTAFFTGRIVDHQGRPIPKSGILWQRPAVNFALHSAADGEEGTFAIGPLAPGTYSLTAQAPGRGVVPLGTLTLARNEKRDLGEVRFETPGSITVRLLDSGGKATGQFYCSLYSEEGLHIGGARAEDGEALLEHVPPGEWLLSTHVDFAHRAAARVTVRRGETTRIDLRPVPARTVAFVLESERSAESLGMPSLLVRDAGGRTVHAGVTAALDGVSSARVPLLPGDYEVEVLAAGGLRGRASVHVPDGPGEELRVRIPLERLGR